MLYERARMELLATGSLASQRLSQINNTQDPNQRAANEQRLFRSSSGKQVLSVPLLVC